jgi:hypothetical protein
MLSPMFGELEYLAPSTEDQPVLSFKHEQSVRVNTAAVKDAFPADEFPDYYQASSSRPLRIL